ncbi:MAG: DUF1700 domain-containing protein [Oscillospiraceae bacterium]|nr:DUF1700 domain-containing protein [Oscillospiraceae bacterium]
MTAQEYCTALDKLLKKLPSEERQETVRYYTEYLEDASEEEKAALGTPGELAEKILRENGIEPKVKNTNNGKRKTVIITILVCTFYIWIPLLLAYYIILLCTLICVAIIPILLAFAFCLALVTAPFCFTQFLPRGLLILGGGFVSIGIGLLLLKPFWIACRSIVKFGIFTAKKLWSICFD